MNFLFFGTQTTLIGISLSFMFQYWC